MLTSRTNIDKIRIQLNGCKMRAKSFQWNYLMGLFNRILILQTGLETFSLTLKVRAHEGNKFTTKALIKFCLHSQALSATDIGKMQTRGKSKRWIGETPAFLFSDRQHLPMWSYRTSSTTWEAYYWYLY